MFKHEPTDFLGNDLKLNGIYRGVVEDNIDPKKAGRCRVRIAGLHTSAKDSVDYVGIPTNELPWAQPVYPIIGGSTSGVGIWGVPVNGSWVYLFFENGDPQAPRYFASIPAIPSIKADTSKGFNDPTGTYPVESLLNQPDYNRLARGIYTNDSLSEQIEFIKQQKAKLVLTLKNQATIDALDLQLEQLNKEYDYMENGPAGTYVPIINDGRVEVNFGEDSWTEPGAYWSAIYPYNLVIANGGTTTDGSYIPGPSLELDSTPNHMRVTLFHPSASRLDIDQDGSMVIKNTSDRYDFINNNYYCYAKEATILAAETTLKLLSKESMTLSTEGPVTIKGSEIILDGPIVSGPGGGGSLSGTSNITGDIVNITGNKIYLTGEIYINGVLFTGDI